MPVGHDRVRLGLGLRDRGAGLQPADHAVAARAARFQFVFRKRDRLPHVRALGEGPALDAEKREREFEIGRHDADDREAAAVDRHLAADKPWIGIETSPPEALADHDDAIIAVAELAVVENATANRCYAQQRKQARRDHGALNALRHVAAGEIEVREVERGDPLITARLFFPIQIFRRGHGDLVETLRGEFFEQENEILRRLER